MTTDTLDIASVDLAEARAKIEAARMALLKAEDDHAVRAVIQKLDRIEADLKRVESAVAGVGVPV